MSSKEPSEGDQEPEQVHDEPERFPPEVLEQSVETRLEYFEDRCLIEHPRLLEALETTIQAICSPGEGAGRRRPGTMVLVIGPSRVGKTTLIHLLEERLLARAKAQMQHDQSFIPFASITTTEPGSGRFDWIDYYKPVLRQLGNPFVDSRTAPIRARELREAMEEALLQRKPLAIIVDEAHHLAKARSGRRLQDNLDHLKYIENVTSVSHVLVGTYEMRPFRKVNAQLACRSMDVHFPRYDLINEDDCQIFGSVLWALQRQMPVVEEPLLAEHHWEFLYARSIGCIGLLKLHLNRALNLALTEGAKTVTETHLRQTAPSDVRVKHALRNILESEAEFVEAEDADEQLLTLLGRPSPTKEVKAGDLQTPTLSPTQPSRVGRRAPGRDSIGLEPDVEASNDRSNEEQEAG
jgi:AAA domain